MTRTLTPQQRLQALIAGRPKPPPRSAQWIVEAKRLAREHGLNANGVLDMHDHLADLLEWDGAERADAEWRAWQQTVEILVPKRAA